MQPITISTNLQSGYDEQYTDVLSKWRELGAKYKARHIVDLCAQLNIRSALEVGAGEGSILKYLDEWDFCESLYAVEISRSGIDFIKKRNIARVRDIQQFDGYSLPYANDQFDLVVLSHVIEHVEFPRLLLREIRRVSKYQIIEIPCDFAFDVDQHVDHFLSYGHINIYIPVLLRFLLKTEGFAILGDKLSLWPRDVIEYNYYINQNHPKSTISMLKIRAHLLKARLAFRFVKPSRKELLAQAYTVLCQASDKNLSIF